MQTLARLAVATLAIAACTGGSAGPAGRPADGWVPLFDGRTLAGWRASEHPETFRVEDGAIVVRGPRAHLFYDGPVLDHRFRDFELRAEVLTRPARTRASTCARRSSPPTGRRRATRCR